MPYAISRVSSAGKFQTVIKNATARITRTAPYFKSNLSIKITNGVKLDNVLLLCSDRG